MESESRWEVTPVINGVPQNPDNETLTELQETHRKSDEKVVSALAAIALILEEMLAENGGRLDMQDYNDDGENDAIE